MSFYLGEVVQLGSSSIPADVERSCGLSVIDLLVHGLGLPVDTPLRIPLCSPFCLDVSLHPYAFLDNKCLTGLFCIIGQVGCMRKVCVGFIIKVLAGCIIKARVERMLRSFVGCIFRNCVLRTREEIMLFLDGGDRTARGMLLSPEVDEMTKAGGSSSVR